MTARSTNTQRSTRKILAVVLFVIAGALLLVLVQLLPEKESAQKLAHFFIAIALIVALLMGFKDFRKDKEEE